MIDAIKKLREKTNAGVVDCQKALKEANGDTEKAIEILRKRGVALATKKVLSKSLKRQERWYLMPVVLDVRPVR